MLNPWDIQVPLQPSSSGPLVLESSQRRCSQSERLGFGGFTSLWISLYNQNPQVPFWVPSADSLLAFLLFTSIALLPALATLELLRWTFSCCWLLEGLTVSAFGGAVLGSQSSQKTFCSDAEISSYQGRVLEVR